MALASAAIAHSNLFSSCPRPPPTLPGKKELVGRRRGGPTRVPVVRIRRDPRASRATVSSVGGNPILTESDQNGRDIGFVSVHHVGLLCENLENVKKKLSSSRARISGTRNPKKGEQVNEAYLGYEMWSPVTPKPKVNKPRSVHTAATLAYLGDCIFELYARRHFLFPPLSIDVYNERVKSVVRCEGQDTLLKKLQEDGDYLTDEERDILRWGKNNASSKARTRKRAGMAVYTRASSLETLIGHLYLTDTKRLEDAMSRLGFSAGCSNEKIVEKQHRVVECDLEEEKGA